MTRVTRALILLILLAAPARHLLLAQGWLFDHPGVNGDELFGIAFTDANHAVVAGYVNVAGDALILTTTDGGQSWNRRPAGFHDELHAVAAVSPWTWAVAGEESVHVTHDAGATWRSAPVADALHLRGIAFTDSLHGVVVGATTAGKSLVARTTDGGASWAVKTPVIAGGNTIWPLNGVAFVDGSVGTAVGDRGEIFRTVDGGETWISTA